MTDGGTCFLQMPSAKAICVMNWMKIVFHSQRLPSNNNRRGMKVQLSDLHSSQLPAKNRRLHTMSAMKRGMSPHSRIFCM